VTITERTIIMEAIVGVICFAAIGFMLACAV
jgi:hypothetical protein